MAIKIDKKITEYSVARPEDKAEKPAVKEEKGVARGGNKVIQMHEKLERPDELVGSTYKVKTPVSDHAMYITINDILLNPGTDHEQRRPFEIFINSKNLDHYQWIVALTRIISAVFRKGGDVTFLVEELKAVFDPRGGYWKPGGKFMPSLIAELGEVIERHLTKIGLIQPEGLDEYQQQLVEQKRAEWEAQNAQKDAFAEQ
ncbi:MAG: NrdJb, partial [Gammaproteobacteria bacterium]